MLRKSDRAAWQKFDQELVLLDMPSRTLLGLNPVAGLVWEQIDGTRSLGEVASKIAEQFQTSEPQVFADVLTFARDLMARGCVAVTERT